MKRDNRRRNKAQRVNLRAEDVQTADLAMGEQSPQWRFFT